MKEPHRAGPYRYILYAFDYLTFRLKGTYQQLLTARSGPEENEDEEILFYGIHIDLYKHWIAYSYSPSTEQMSLIERRHRRFRESVHARRA